MSKSYRLFASPGQGAMHMRACLHLEYSEAKLQISNPDHMAEIKQRIHYELVEIYSSANRRTCDPIDVDESVDAEMNEIYQAWLLLPPIVPISPRPSVTDDMRIAVIQDLKERLALDGCDEARIGAEETLNDLLVATGMIAPPLTHSEKVAACQAAWAARQQ